jgi:hypothetical protein
MVCRISVDTRLQYGWFIENIHRFMPTNHLNGSITVSIYSLCQVDLFAMRIHEGASIKSLWKDYDGITYATQWYPTGAI